MILFAGEIIRQECEKYKVDRRLVLSPRRSKKLTEIRRAIIARMQSEYGLGPSEIGRLLYRDHTTICHHIEIIKSQNSSLPVNPSPRADQAKKAAADPRHPDSSPAAATDITVTIVHTDRAARKFEGTVEFR